MLRTMLTTVPRAERVVLPISITYHVPGDDFWFNGRVLNISESGVLFGPTELQPGTPIEVIFSMPVQVGAMASGKMVCGGEVVRKTDAGETAARFEECRFLLES